MKKIAVMLCAAVMSFSAADAQVSTSKMWTFTSANWEATRNGEVNNWTSTADGSSFDTSKGICVTGGGTVFSSGNAKTSSANLGRNLTNINKIEVVYSTGNYGAGEINVKVGETEVGNLTTSNNTSETTYTIADLSNSGIPSISVTANGHSGTSRNNVYVKSVTITYSAESPVFSVAEGRYYISQTVGISQNDGLAFQYSINGGDSVKVPAGETATVEMGLDEDGNNQTYVITAATDLSDGTYGTPVSATYEIIYSKHYELVNDASSLKANDKVIIARGNEAMGAEKANGGVRYPVAGSLKDNVLYIADDARVFTLKTSGNESFPWSLWSETENGYLAASQIFINTGTGLPVQSSIDNKAMWKLTSQSEGATEINNNANADIRFSTDNNGEFYACWYDYNYHKDVQVYRDATPSVKFELYHSESNAGAQNLTWDSVEDGACYDTVTKVRFSTATAGTVFKVTMTTPEGEVIEKEFTATDEILSFEESLEEYTTAGEYTFKINTSYNDIIAQAKTFKISIEGSTSSVDGIKTTSKITVVENGIEIAGNGLLTIVNAAGQISDAQMVNGHARISLAPGFYVVRIADKVAKVVVK